MNDYLVRGMSMDGFVKAVAIRSTELVRRGAEIQKTTPNATAAFGRALTAASMMGNMQKVDNGSMTLQIKGDGPIGTIVCVSDPIGNVRGYVYEPNVPVVEKYPGKLDVGATVGRDGTLTVIRDLQMKEPYVGSIPLVSGEIGDDVTAYFAQSEQTPTACALGVLVDTDCSVKVAGGYILQLLPGAPDETIDKLETGIKRAGAVTAMLDAGMAPEEMLGQVCGDLGILFMETTPVEYKCYCTRSRVEAALISLGRKELTEIMAEGKPFPVECQFCDEKYIFTPAEIADLLRGLEEEM
ncbi:MAG: Hsp33 family molecular chaperone HslO [Oscillospiraceae bacterium]|nr:Hsp33 family molecular chaperone HslO [Oscillospiraceae bacterium]